MPKQQPKSEKKQIRVLMGAIALIAAVFAVIKYWRVPEAGAPIVHLVIAAAGIVLFLISLAAPTTLRPLYKAWMVFAHAIGWFNARLFLTILFFIMFTPIALIMRLLGRDPLNRDFRSERKSFWVKREEPEGGVERYKRQF